MTAGQGGFEIERRYLVRVRPDLVTSLGPGHDLRQGYLKSSGPSVRIRTGEPRGPVLTCKSGGGVKRREVETVVPPEVAAALFDAAGKRVIEKTRYPIGPWELDRFAGSLDGLFLMEIELDHETDPIPPPPEGVQILREVTEDKRFTSNSLARMTEEEKARLVTAVYGEGGG